MSSTQAAARALQECAALRSVGAARAYDAVRAACDALVAGLDGPALRSLAACTRGEADYDVPYLLPTALEELGLDVHPAGSSASHEAGVRALAGQVLSGDMTPRALAFEVHRLFGHQLPIADRLAELDDDYDLLDVTRRTPAQVDADVIAEARRLAHRR